MSRGLTAAQQSATLAPHRQIVPLIELFFDSGALRFALGPWDYISQSGTYIHLGALAYIKPATESTGSTEGLEIGMSGLDTAMIAIATSEPYRGRIMRLLKGFFASDTNDPIGEPKAWFVGRMQNMTITEDNQKANIAIVAEHYEVELSRPAPIRYSDADQQRLHPGDLGCQYAAEVSAKSIIFPSKEAQRI